MPISANDTRLYKVGFCCLKGDGIEHYAKKYEIVVGRKSKSTALDVAIGDNMNISRQHATISYNFVKGRNTPVGVWELRVHGKNGVTVRDTLYTPSSPAVSLQSGDLLQLGDRAFFFLLGKGSRQRQRAPKVKRGVAGGVSKPTVSQHPLPALAATNEQQRAAVLTAPEQLAAAATLVPRDGMVASSVPIPLPSAAGQQQEQRQQLQQQQASSQHLQNQQQPAAIALPQLFHRLGAAGGTPLAHLAAASQHPPAGRPQSTTPSNSMPQLGLQNMLAQQFGQPGQQALRPAQAQMLMAAGGVSLPQVSPLLQQLMAASVAMNTGAVPSLGSAAGAPQLRRGNELVSQEAREGPTSQAGKQNLGGAPQAVAQFPYPEGFPGQLLQGLQHHQQLQQLAHNQGEASEQPQGASVPRDTSEQSSAAK